MTSFEIFSAYLCDALRHCGKYAVKKAITAESQRTAENAEWKLEYYPVPTCIENAQFADLASFLRFAGIYLANKHAEFRVRRRVAALTDVARW